MRTATVPFSQTRLNLRSSSSGFRVRMRTTVASSNFGKEVVEGFFDLSKLVASDAKAGKSPYEELAYKTTLALIESFAHANKHPRKAQIGKDVYADMQLIQGLQGWHVLLKDLGSGVDQLKMNQVLATMFGPMHTSGKVDEKEVEAALRRLPIRLGGGKLRVPLWDVLPSSGVRDLMDILKEKD